MPFFRKIKSFLNVSGEVRRLFFKAYFLSALVKLTLVFMPFSRVLKWQGAVNSESPQGPDISSAGFRKSLQSAIQMCDKYTLWKTECYTQALTAKILLNRQGIAGTIYIGFKKTEKGEYKGHAWLRSYDRIITGNIDLPSYSIHSFYT